MKVISSFVFLFFIHNHSHKASWGQQMKYNKITCEKMEDQIYFFQTFNLLKNVCVKTELF